MEQKQRKSPRASWYDYTSPGGYFITICTKDRTHYFGEIQDGQMILNELGNICAQAIDQISTRKSVDIHEWIVMPNHVHIVLVMSGYPTNVGADHQSALHNTNYKGDLLNRPYNGPSLSSIVKLFKGHITKYAQQHGIVFGWQRSFHDHIIRNETEYERIKYYIQTNPQNRTNDTFYAL